MQVKDIHDVEMLAHRVKEELGLAFHPDDPFEDYIYLDSGKPVYSDKAATLLTVLIEQAFEICQKEKKDIYALMGRIIVKDTFFHSMFD